MFGRDKTKKDVYMLKTLLNMFKRKQIRKDHKLQRNADQWKEKEAASGLVASVIKDEDIDPIKICEELKDNEFILWLIDGLQRLTTLDKYRNNAFKISKQTEMPFVFYRTQNNEGEIKTIKYDLREKYFRDLPEELKEQFDSYSMEVVKHLDCTEEEIGYHIARYNRQCNWNNNQKNILPMYKIAEFIKNISQNHTFFYNCGDYSETDIIKNATDRIVCDSVMSIFHLDKWIKNGKKMGEYLNNNATKEEFDILKSELDRLSLIIDQDTTGKLFNIKNSFIWFTAFHIFSSYNLEDKKFVEFLIEFQKNLHNKTFEKHDNQSFDTYDSYRNTKDKKIVFAKIDIIKSLMEDYFEINKQITLSEYVHERDISTENIESTEIENITKNTEDNSNTSELNTVVNFVQDILQDKNINEKDILNYRDFLEDILKITNPLYQQCKPALIALTSYAYKTEQDVELSEWLTKYSQSKVNFGQNQKNNYIYLKRAFTVYYNKVKENENNENDTT